MRFGEAEFTKNTLEWLTRNQMFNTLVFFTGKIFQIDWISESVILKNFVLEYRPSRMSTGRQVISADISWFVSRR